MNWKTLASMLGAVALVAVAGCDAGPEATAPAAEDTAVVDHDEHDSGAEPGHEAGARTDLDPLTLGDYTVTAWHLGPPTDGHFNFRVDGGAVGGVLVWVGDEAATDAFVGRAEWEVDHYCSHLEVADPLPQGAKVWVELETLEGEALKGSLDLKP